MKSFLPEDNSKVDIAKRNSFYIPQALSEEQNCRFLKYRGVSMPNENVPILPLFNGSVQVELNEVTFVGRHFKVTNLVEKHIKFDRTMSESFTWQITRRNPFVTVLIHNVPTDEIIMVEQFRPATMNMDGLPAGIPYTKCGTMLELVAGGLGKDDPEDCARREAMEEAKIELGDIFFMPGAHPSPGGTDEYGYLIYAPVDVDTTNKSYTGGLPEENEDIFVRWVRFEKALSMCLSGEIKDQKTQNGILFGEKFRRRSLE